MARRKVKIAWIVNDNARKASMKKRRVGLLQKVRELSILCDVSAAIIIYSPDDSEPMTWPSRSNVQEILARFNSMSEMERSKKMVNLETYLNESMSKLREALDKHRLKVTELEASIQMHHVYQDNGLDKLGEMDMQTVLWFAQEKRKEIQKRLDYQNTVNALGSLPIATPLQSHTTPTYAQASRLIRDQMTINIGDNIGGSNLGHQEWFIKMKNNNENIVGSSSTAKADQMASQNTTEFGGDIDAHDDGLPYEVTKQWPKNFSP